MIDEGYVKFQSHWRKGPAPTGIEALVDVRNQLYALGLIGEYAEIKIGFGNVSLRAEGGKFWISGSATGGIPKATPLHFCLVEGYDIQGNTVECIGPVTASSETMTHAMLYVCSASIGAVLHVHHLGFWEYLLQTAPSSAPEVPYGTPAMALEMRRLMATSDLPKRKILAMAGHAEGIIAIGPTVHEALLTLLSEYTKWEKMSNFEKKSGGGV